MTTNEKGRVPGKDATLNEADHTNNSTPYGPDFVQISVDEQRRRLAGGVPCVMITRFEHEGGCPTLKTNRGNDCRCNPDVSYWLDKGCAI